MQVTQGGHRNNARGHPGDSHPACHAQVAELVQAALANGRTWTEIADRLGMSPSQAKRSYGTKLETKSRPPRTIGSVLLNALADMLQAASRALSAAEGMAREHSRH